MNDGSDLKMVTPQRLDYKKESDKAFQAMLSMSKVVHDMSIEESLLNLVFIRASQINGCAWCMNMHTEDAKKAGENNQRMLMLPVWRDVPIYTEREAAALEWTEMITKLSENDIPDDKYNAVKKWFTKEELVDLTMAIIAINGWNSLNVAFKSTVVCNI